MVDALEIILLSSKKRVILTTTPSGINVSNDTDKQEITFREIIHVEFNPQDSILTLTYLRRKKPKTPLVLDTIKGTVQTAEPADAQEWASHLLSKAYEGLKQGRRVKVVVNPHSGVRKSLEIWNKIVEPILRSAHFYLDITITERRHHAYDIAKSMPLDFDVVACVSGDGLIHEILNGFADHEHPTKALDIPIGPIPTGSGNGLSLNLFGLDDGFDPACAALNIVKGFPMKVDLFSIVQDGKRTLSFMSQALGLMADLDVGTEHLRWMGDTRFVYGLLRGLIQFKPCPVQLSYKAVESDKDKMVNDLQTRREISKDLPPSHAPSAYERYGPQLPSLKRLPDELNGWTVFDKPLLWIYAGQGPYVGRDFMAFPVSLPNDGLIDLVAQSLEGTSRGEIIKFFPSAAQGTPYWAPSQYYIKATAYRVKPLQPKGALAIDGEIFPFKEFQVEVHQELGTLLSPHGYYAADFRPRTKS